MTEPLGARASVMPTVELNVNLVGTIPRAQALAAARRNGVRELLEVPEARIDDARSLDEFLYVFDAVAHVLRSPEDLRRAVHHHLTAVAALGVVHTELLWSPMVHLDDGVGYRAQLDGLRAGITEAEADTGTTCRLLATIDRERRVADAHALLDLVLAHRDELVVGVGLAYGERLAPAPFAEVFHRAGEAGLGRSAFAGETGDPRDVAVCIDQLGCSRISHGYAVLDNRRVTARARNRGVHFVVSPSTVRHLRAWGVPGVHAVAEMVRADLCVSLSSNNPARYGTDIVEEQRAAAAEGIPGGRLEVAVDDAVAAAFLDDTERAVLHRRIARRRELATGPDGT